jgi:alpha-tubulin suppressor-like RCC1 family protein
MMTSAGLLRLPLEMLTAICLHLDLRDIARTAKTCKRFRSGESELDTVERPTKSPVIAALSELGFTRPEVVPSTRPDGCSESWVAYLGRCALQRGCREAPLIAAGWRHSLFVDGGGRLLACGRGAAVGHGDLNAVVSTPAPVAIMAGIRVRSVAAGSTHSLAVSWDGRVYSWGDNSCAKLGHGDRLARPTPTLVQGVEGVRGVAVSDDKSLALTQCGLAFRWGRSPMIGEEDSLRPTAIEIERFGGVRLRYLCTALHKSFAIGEEGQIFSWGRDRRGILGHGDKKDQPSPKRVEALRDVRASSVSSGWSHALALTESGQVYAWGENTRRATTGNPNAASELELLPRLVEALRGVRVANISVAGWRSYAVSDIGQLWAWGIDRDGDRPLGHGERRDCSVPRPIQSLRSVKVNAVVAGDGHTLALAADGFVYAWGGPHAERTGALGLGRAAKDAKGESISRSVPRRGAALAPLTHCFSAD